MARTKYGYAESSNIKATIAGHTRSAVNADLPIENGTLWKLGDKTTDSDEIYNVTRPAAGDKVWLALSALYAYDTSSTLGQHEMFLRKEAGEAARIYELVENDRFAVADYMITPVTSGSAPVIGNLLKVDPSTGKYIEIAKTTSTDSLGFVAQIQSIEYKSNLTIVRLRVLKNEQVA